MTGREAAESACALADCTSLGRLIATGPDILGLLHRLSTGDVAALSPGEGRPTVLTSPKGRIIERLFVHHLGPDGIGILTGPASATRVLDHMARYTFAENTGLRDVTGATFAFGLIGRSWRDAARAAGIPDLAPYGAIRCTVAGHSVYAVRTNGFDDDGMILMGPADAAGAVHGALAGAVAGSGGEAIDASDLEAWRILRGLPAPGRELTEDYNPLEAGLSDAISFTKGCYVGQEVIARLNTYKKVARGIVRLRLTSSSTLPPLGSTVLSEDGSEVGTLTSVCRVGAQEAAGLAYVKRRVLAPDASSVIVVSGSDRWGADLLRP